MDCCLPQGYLAQFEGLLPTDLISQSGTAVFPTPITFNELCQQDGSFKVLEDENKQLACFCMKTGDAVKTVTKASGSVLFTAKVNTWCEILYIKIFGSRPGTTK